MNNLVTVVIPTNRSQFLDEAINSVLSQTIKCDLLIVDDGANPSIKSQINDKFPGIKIIRHDKNLGLPTARNTGVRNCKTEFLVFLDCDDILEPDFCKEMVKECRRSKTSAEICLPKIFFSSNFPTRKKLLFYLLGRIRDLSVYFCYFLNRKKLTNDGFFLVQFSHTLFRTETLSKFPSDKKYLYVNDWELMVRILAKEQVGILPKRLTNYRYHSNGQSQDKNSLVKWTYTREMLKEIPPVGRKGIFYNLFNLYVGIFSRISI